MSQELKLRIDDPAATEVMLLRKGASFLSETRFTDTYFNQPEGKVLKVAWRENDYFLDRLEAENGKFQVVESRKMDDPEAMAEELAAQHGVKRVLRGKRRFFALKDYKITLNSIDNIGEFLIVTGQNPSKDFVKTELGIKNPEYIIVSFDELKRLH